MLKGTNVAAEEIYEGSGLNYNICEVPPFFSLEGVHENKFILFSCYFQLVPRLPNQCSGRKFAEEKRKELTQQPHQFFSLLFSEKYKDRWEDLIRQIEYCLEITSILRILLLLLLLMWKQLECLAQKLLLIFFQTDCSLPKKHLYLPMKKQNNHTLPLRCWSLHLVSYALRFNESQRPKITPSDPQLNRKTGKKKQKREPAEENSF